MLGAKSGADEGTEVQDQVAVFGFGLLDLIEHSFHDVSVSETQGRCQGNAKFRGILAVWLDGK